MPDERGEEREVGGHPAHGIAVEGGFEPIQRLVPVPAGGDELRDHGVVPHRDLAALLHPVVHPHPGPRLVVRGIRGTRRAQGSRRCRGPRPDRLAPLVRAVRAARPARRPGRARRPVAEEPPRRGQEVALRVLRIHPRLHRPAVHAHLVLGEGQRLPGRDPDHPLHEVEPGDRLRHRVLHLEPGVHLEEVEPAGLVHDELDRTGRPVADRAGEGHRLSPHPRPHPGIDEGGRGLLEHLLMPPLHRAFALAEVEHRAAPVREDLHLDVPRALHVALDEDPPVAETRERLVRRAPEPLADLLLPGRDPHPLAAAARRRLQHHRVADLARRRRRLVRAGKRPVQPRNRVDPRVGGEPARLDLVPHRPDRGRRRPDEGDAGRFERLREPGVLGEEPESGVHRVRPGGPGRLHHRLDVEIALRRRGRTHAHRRVRHPHVRGAFVRLGVDRRDGDPHAARGPRDAAGDLAPVRDEDALEHR